MTSTRQAGAIVFRNRASTVEILLVSPKHGEAEWIFPKGHIEKDESADAAARREAREEAGVRGVVIGSAGEPLEFMSGREQVSVEYFIVEATGEEPPEDTRRRHRWFAAADALAALTHEPAKSLLARVLPAIDAHVAARERHN